MTQSKSKMRTNNSLYPLAGCFKNWAGYGHSLWVVFFWIFTRDMWVTSTRPRLGFWSGYVGIGRLAMARPRVDIFYPREVVIML